MGARASPAVLQAVELRLSNTNYADHWSSFEVTWPPFGNRSTSLGFVPSPLWILHPMFAPLFYVYLPPRQVHLSH